MTDKYLSPELGVVKAAPLLMTTSAELQSVSRFERMLLRGVGVET